MNIDVIVLDYGLTKGQVAGLKKENVTVVKCVKDGHVNIIRFRDMAHLLKKNKYDIVMATDGGDIIFQADISGLFEKDNKSQRAVYEDSYIDFKELFLKNNFSLEAQRRIKKVLDKKKMINAGVLIAPSSKFIKMCEECFSLIKTKTSFGPDQIAVNYILHRDGFEELDKVYNFVVSTVNKKFYVKEGVFYSENKKIPVVHNSGRVSFFRPVKDFGYGQGYNKVKKLTLCGIRVIFQILNFLKKEKRVRS